MARIATPCRDICISDPAIDLCLGYGRSFAEIAGWQAMTDRQRTDVMMNLPHRLVTIDDGRVRGDVG
ncbi:MAG: DUF1289 domain-containing protein [Rhizobiales bacterium]|nr:DUF1289 domain-containing protein [Hyphomicrobiales bacterium]